MIFLSLYAEVGVVKNVWRNFLVCHKSNISNFFLFVM